MSSPDTSYNTYNKITSIDWNGQVFILTARNEITQNAFEYAYSYNGLSWTKANLYPNVTTKNPYTVKFLGDKFIIAGNLISSSVNELSNTVNTNCLVNIVDAKYPVTIPTKLNNTIFYDIEANIEHSHRIVFPRTIILSLGTTISYSVDQGQSWTSILSSPFSNSVKDAIWNGKIWVAVGTGNANTIATSLDGITWTGRGNYIFSTSCNGIDWSSTQRKYVAVGNGTNIVATSMDGIYWKGINTNLFSGGGNDIKWNGKIWVAVGNNGGSGNTIAYSYDAISWQYSTTTFQTSGLRIYYDTDNSFWNVYGSDPSYNIANSSDGINWTLSYSATANSLRFQIPSGLFADPSLNLYPEIPFPLYTNTVSGINKFVYNHSDRGCAYIQPISIACGSGQNSLAYSIDGIRWISINNSLFTRCNKAIWNGKIWVVVGYGSYWIATSYDGMTWTGQNNTLMTECYDIAWNGTYFVAVGYNSTLASIAKSTDGISWTSVSINSIFSTKTHAIEWTGNVWLAYGSGTNTTAISSSLDASVWTSTTTPNLCVVDCSNILLNNISSISASSSQGINTPINAFDNSFNNTITKWTSATSKYDISGNYIGTSYTQGISGEWLQVQLTSPLSCSNYYIVFSIADGNSIPKSWSFLGSNNGVSWTILDTFNYGTSTPPNNNWKYPFVCLPLDVNSVGTYSYYRIVFTSNFGATAVSVSELALFNSGSKNTDQYIRPIVLKDLILHPTRILSVDGTIPNIYRITDLSCNFIRSGVVHNGLYVNNIIYGLTSEPTATVFDGTNHVVFSISGEVSYLSNSASNTNLNFDNSMNGVAITGKGSSVYSACYNRKFILTDSSYGVLNENVIPRFYSNNLSSLFTSINGLASNSGYGFVVSPNTIYLQNNERLSVITPKFYDNALSSDTSISFNLYKSDS